MTFVNNDHWSGEFPVETLGTYVYRIEAWVDAFATWRRDFQKRLEASQDIESELQVAAGLLAAASRNASGEDATRLAAAQRRPRRARRRSRSASQLALDEALSRADGRARPRGAVAAYDRGQRILVDRERARFSAWYELFPRSTSPIPGKHGTFKTTIAWLPYIARDGLRRALPAADPPDRRDEPQGHATTRRPARRATPAAPGPSAAQQGGHKAVNPDLGTLGGLPRARRSGARPRHRGRARHRLPVLAGPPLGQRAPAVVQAPPGRHASATPRTRRSTTRTSTRSTSRRRTGRRSGRSSRASSASGSTRAYASSASTTRTRSRSRSGSG